MKKDVKPLSSSIANDLAHTAFVRAIFNLDDESFNAVAWAVYQQSKTAGGFKDREGWARVRAAAEKLPFIAEQQKKVDAEEADKKPPTPVKPS